MGIGRLPWQANQRGQQRAHGTHAVDQAFADEARVAGWSASSMRGQQGLQLLPDPSISGGRIGDDRADSGEQLLIQRRPIAVCNVGTGRGASLQVGDLAPDHHEQAIRGGQQAIAHEAGDLDAARRLADQGSGRRWPPRQAPGMAP